MLDRRLKRFSRSVTVEASRRFIVMPPVRCVYRIAGGICVS